MNSQLHFKGFPNGNHNKISTFEPNNGSISKLQLRTSEKKIRPAKHFCLKIILTVVSFLVILAIAVVFIGLYIHERVSDEKEPGHASKRNAEKYEIVVDPEHCWIVYEIDLDVTLMKWQDRCYAMPGNQTKNVRMLIHQISILLSCGRTDSSYRMSEQPISQVLALSDMSRDLCRSIPVYWLYRDPPESSNPINATFVRETDTTTPVNGIAVVNKLVYSIQSNETEVHIYDTNLGKMNTSGTIPMPGMRGTYDMIYSTSVDSLFVVDYFDPKYITVIQMRLPNNISKWKVSDEIQPLGLSVSNCFGSDCILVTLFSSNSLVEFSPEGSIMKTIQLKMIRSPRQALKLDENSYAVCFGYYPNEAHQVCLVNSSGDTQTCFGGCPGSSLHQLNVPARVIAGFNGSILVADRDNKRILKLDPSLSNPQVIRPETNALNGPTRLFLDKKERVLYVGDNTIQNERAVEGRIIAIRI